MLVHDLAIGRVATAPVSASCIVLSASKYVSTGVFIRCSRNDIHNKFNLINISCVEKWKKEPNLLSYEKKNWLK